MPPTEYHQHTTHGCRHALEVMMTTEVERSISVVSMSSRILVIEADVLFNGQLPRTASQQYVSRNETNKREEDSD